MRIVHVVRQYAPSVGGLEAVVGRLAFEQRARLGHDVRVVTLDRLFSAPRQRLRASETIDGVPVTRLPWSGSSRYPFCPQVLGQLADADLVHVHAIDFFFDWLSATRWIHRKAMVASTHGGFFHTAYASRLKRVWFRTITRWSALGYRRIVATSENDGAVFRTVAGDRVVVVENGADIARYRDAASREPTRTMIFFGRWSSNKGLFELIDLFAAMHARDPRWRLIIAGRPYDLTVGDLRTRMASLGLVGAVALHEAPSDDALRALMTRATYFACLSRHEGFGIAAIEALSAGLVPILSDIPPFRKIVDEARCGLLLPLAGDAASGAEAVASLAASPLPEGERARRLAFAARYDWPAVVDRYDVQYRAALANARGSSMPAAGTPR